MSTLTYTKGIKIIKLSEAVQAQAAKYFAVLPEVPEQREFSVAFVCAFRTFDARFSSVDLGAQCTEFMTTPVGPSHVIAAGKMSGVMAFDAEAAEEYVSAQLADDFGAMHPQAQAFIA